MPASLCISQICAAHNFVQLTTLCGSQLRRSLDYTSASQSVQFDPTLGAHNCATAETTVVPVCAVRLDTGSSQLRHSLDSLVPVCAARPDCVLMDVQCVMHLLHLLHLLPC